MRTREASDRFGKRLFAEPQFVADLLRGFVPSEILGDLDFGTLRPVPAEFINRDGDKRIGDALWLADRPSGTRVLVLVELESTNRRRIAARVMGEVGVLYESLTDAAKDPDGHFPAVLPLVVYTGEGRWHGADDIAATVDRDDPLAAFVAGRRFAALDAGRLALDDLPPRNRLSVFVRMHASPSADALATDLRSAFEWLGQDERSLRDALLDWVYAVVLPRRFPAADRQPFERLGEEVTMLEDRVKQWTEEWYEEGRQRGVEQGLQRGVEQGMKRGVEQGLQRGIAVLRRQASRRFGHPAGERVATVLSGVTDPVRFERVGDLIVDCASSEDFLGRLNGSAD